MGKSYEIEIYLEFVSGRLVETTEEVLKRIDFLEGNSERISFGWVVDGIKKWE
jgi:hypothetical protein